MRPSPPTESDATAISRAGRFTGLQILVPMKFMAQSAIGGQPWVGSGPRAPSRLNVDAAILLGPGKSGVDRTGSDLTSFTLPAANPAMCQQSCADNANCRSWAYVNPGVQGVQA